MYPFMKASLPEKAAFRPIERLHARQQIHRPSSLAAAGRSVKLDLKEDGDTLAEALEVLDRTDLTDERLWFNADIQALGPEGFAEVRARHPGATISCPAAPCASSVAIGFLTFMTAILLLIRCNVTDARIDLFEPAFIMVSPAFPPSG